MSESRSRMKAIEVSYKGCRFRSRLEARWAVFLEELGIEWRYEEEGWDLPVNGYYLPDFWLPENKVWVEIKGPAPTERDKAKIVELGYESDKLGHKMRLLVGDIPHQLAKVPIGESFFEIPEGCIGVKGTSQAFNRLCRKMPLGDSRNKMLEAEPALKRDADSIWLFDCRGFSSEQRPSPGPGASGVEILGSGYRIETDPIKTVPGVHAYGVTSQFMWLTKGQANKYAATGRAGGSNFPGQAIIADPEDKLENWGISKSVWILGGKKEEDVLSALNAARSARFEHGQKGPYRGV